MEEKERYKYREVSNEIEHYECYWDNKEGCELFDDEAVLNRLNEQDYELKKLNQENIKLIKENQQLKQSQKQLAIGELRRIKEYILINDEYDEEVGCNIIETFDLLEDIRDRIEQLGGEENE